MDLITYLRFGNLWKERVLTVLLGISLGLTATIGLAEATSRDQKTSTDQFVDGILENEIRAQKEDQSLWQYQETKKENGKEERLEVIETRGGDLERLVAVNGEPLAAEPRQREEARIRHLISDRQAFQNERRKQQEDFDQELKLLRMLGTAFHYQDAGQDGKLRRVNFTPNPSFRPPSREGEVFHHMSGSLWLD